ncbi:Hypothetical protein A7982_11614 [Minicystis rosea]|nr:Hypothetical protein A7982_11614 [Minicystis rosea]
MPKPKPSAPTTRDAANCEACPASGARVSASGARSVHAAAMTRTATVKVRFRAVDRGSMAFPWDRRPGGRPGLGSLR